MLYSLTLLIGQADRLLDLPSTKSVSVRPGVHPLKVEVTEGNVNGCQAENGIKA